jgi:DNA uptake protein ComE-like DNA-binding protein
MTYVYGTVGVVLLALVGATPTDASGNAVGVAGHVLQVIFGCLAIPTIGAACVQLAPLRREVYGQTDGTRPSPATRRDVPRDVGIDPAVAAVIASRERQAEARRLVASDHLMARELRIGRPDLGHRYDDGGLVDLNTAPVVVIARICDIDTDTARRMVDARDRQGGTFSNVDEVFVVADVPWPLWERIRDRAIVVE